VITLIDTNFKIIDTSNYVHDTSNLLSIFINDKILNTIHYIVHASNLLTTDTNLKILNTSNYTVSTSNLLANTDTLIKNELEGINQTLLDLNSKDKDQDIQISATMVGTPIFEVGKHAYVKLQKGGLFGAKLQA